MYVYSHVSTQASGLTNPPLTGGYSTVSSLMDKDLDTLLERMKPYLPIDGSASGIFVEELDLKLQQSRDAVMSIQDL
jgi:hypothetical protein